VNGPIADDEHHGNAIDSAVGKLINTGAFVLAIYSADPSRNYKKQKHIALMIISSRPLTHRV